MSSFSALMALSATQTKQSQSAVQNALQERQKKEELKRKQIAEKEAKERELERKMRMKHFEDEKRERERLMRKEDEMKAREALLQRRDQEQRDALRYGPKKAAKMASSTGGSSTKYPTSSTGTREIIRKARLPADDHDDDTGPALTREELRERKHQAELRKQFQTTKRSTHSAAYHRPGKRLPGGAFDMTAREMASEADSFKSVKQRITMMPNALTKLNTVKRDTRTIDEILQDRAKLKESKTLDGDDARGFDDWFGTAKKEANKPPSVATSGANTPVTASQGSHASSSTAPTKKSAVAPKPTTLKTVNKPNGSTGAPLKSVNALKSGLERSMPSKSSLPSAKITKASSSNTDRSSSNIKSSNSSKKRPRSHSRSESPPLPLHKKRNISPQGEDGEDIKSTIWKLFGRDRNSYVQKDVYSDEEDMEADAVAMEREEKFSARIAKREEELALEEERQHEEEKRRRKREKERLAGRG